MSNLITKIGPLGEHQKPVIECKGTDLDALVSVLSRICMDDKKPFIISDAVISQPVFDLTFYAHIDMTGIFNATPEGNSAGSQDESEINAAPEGNSAGSQDESEINAAPEGNSAGSQDESEINAAPEGKSTASQDESKKNKLDMKFLLSKADIKMLKKMKQREEIAIIYDSAKSKYLITDGHIPQEIEAWTGTLKKAPLDLKNNPYGAPIPNLSLKDIKQYIGKSKHILFRVFDGQLEQIQVKGIGPYSFTTSNMLSLQDKKPDHILVAEKFPRVAGQDDFSISLAKDDKGKFWLLTESKLMLGIKTRTFERLE